MYNFVDQSNFGDVGRFHTKFGLPVSENLQKHVPQTLLEFRLKFLLEEVLEFAEAVGYRFLYVRELNQPDRWEVERFSENVDHAKAFDALLDEVYVALGTAHLFGYPWQHGWERVQEANMAKVRASKDGSDSKRGSSFDVIKPPGWTAPDIAGLLVECGWDIEEENNA